MDSSLITIAVESKRTKIAFIKHPYKHRNIVEINEVDKTRTMLQLIIWLPLILGTSSSGDETSTLMYPQCSEYMHLELLAVACTNKELTQVPVLPNSSKIQILRLSFNEISNLERGAFSGLESLKHLYLSYNRLTVIQTGVFDGLLNLEELDLTYNDISVIPEGAFQGLRSLKRLDLAWNKLTLVGSSRYNGLTQLEELCLHQNQITNLEGETFTNLPSLKRLVLGENKITEISNGVFTGLNITYLDLKKNSISYIGTGAFDGSPSLIEIDLRSNSLKVIRPNAFMGLHPNLSIYSSDPNVCCIAKDSGVACTTENLEFFTYGFPDPIAPVRNVDTTFSSCQDLMHKDTLRIFIWVQGVVAVVFNVGVIYWRLLSKNQSTDRLVQESHKKSTLLLVCLAFGDVCMGVFLLIIAVADQVFRGYYVLQDEEWKQSLWCSCAGFLSAFSSEFTVFLLSLITFDRFYTLLYPARALSWLTVCVTAVCLLVLSAILAAVPLMTTDLANFYNQSGVCLALPLVTNGANGSVSSAMAMSLTTWKYSFSVFIGINTVSVLLIVVCYVKIFVEALRSKRSTTNTSCNRAVKLGERIMMIVGTDMACWLPIIILGIVSACGHHLSSTVYAWVAVFVLPINSAINPLIYTFHTRQFHQYVANVWLGLKNILVWSPPSPLGSSTKIALNEI